MTSFLITSFGLNKLKEEKEKLLQDEKDALESVVIARGYGDFSENAELDAAKEWLDRTRVKMSEIDKKISLAKIFDSSLIDKTKVNFGAAVKVEDLKSGNETIYKIVSDAEFDIAQGKISTQSAIAKGLIGKEVKDEVFIQTPGGEKNFLIKEIDYSWLN